MQGGWRDALYYACMRGKYKIDVPTLLYCRDMIKGSLHGEPMPCTLASHSTSAVLYGAARAAQTLRSALYSKERRTFVANGGSGDWYDRVRAYFRGEVY